jgi:arylformamidase
MDEIIDISPEIHPGIAVFPGDTAFRQEFLLSLQRGDGFTLSKIETTVHLGAHTDAPSHYSVTGQTMETRPLSLYFGPAEVVEVVVERGRRIQVSHLKGRKFTAPRLLFKTGTFPNPDRWNSDFASLSSELIDYLASAGVTLVGIDTPSIDLANDKVLESHQAVSRHGLAILEGIVLGHVQPGFYELIALPLRIRGADASPVRAVLRRS